MGGDGGTKAIGRQYVRGAKAKSNGKSADKEAKSFSRREASRRALTTCSLSNKPLREPVVVCKLGRLYNKEAIIQGLLDKTLGNGKNGNGNGNGNGNNSDCCHIKSLKDVKLCVLHPNKSYKKGEGGKKNGNNGNDRNNGNDGDDGDENDDNVRWM